MRRHILVGGCALVIGLFAFSSTVRAQNKDDHKGHDHAGHDHAGHGHAEQGHAGQGHEGHAHGEGQMADHDAMMKMWEKLAQPGPQHARFKDLVGKWKTVSKHWEPGVSEPQVTYGTASYTLVLDGRYLEEIHHGEHMGKPFEGRGFTGYDNVKQKYVMSWIDNAGTGIMSMEGDYDQATKTMTTQTEFLLPGAGAMKMRMVEREVSDNERVLEMYSTMPGVPKEMKSMEITYTRM